MTFNRISWGYLDSAQALPYSYNTHGILRMLQTVCYRGGNLLLNIGPMINGDVPGEAVGPLKTVGKWLSRHGKAAVYGVDACCVAVASGVGAFTQRRNKLYFWQWIWTDELILGGFETKLKAIRTVPGGKAVGFKQTKRSIFVERRPETARDSIANITMLELEFEGPPVHHPFSAYPQYNLGKRWLADTE